jgi:hypothetical protein
MKGKEIHWTWIVFGGTSTWSKSLTLAKKALYHLSHPNSPMEGIFLKRITTIFWKLKIISKNKISLVILYIYICVCTRKRTLLRNIYQNNLKEKVWAQNRFTLPQLHLHHLHYFSDLLLQRCNIFTSFWVLMTITISFKG